MKKTILILMVAISIFGSLSAVKVFAQQQNDSLEYTLLTPLPCVGGTGSGADFKPDCTQAAQKTTMEKYLPGAFKLAIGLSAVWAVLMIVIGGFQYISTDAIMKKSEGRERIKNAIFGLVLVIGSWLILNTINPNLLKINLNIESAVTTEIPGTLGTISTPGTPMTSDQITASNAVRAALKIAKVDTYAGPCTEGQATGCVNLNGLTNTTTYGLIALKEQCSNCTVMLTAGTEAGVHSATGDHPTGNAVDMKPDSNLNSNLGFPSPKEGDSVTKTFEKNGKTITATFTYEAAGGNARGTSTGNHWHVKFR